MKWIIIVWLITAEWPVGGSVQYGIWHPSQPECWGSLINDRNDFVKRIHEQYPGAKFDDIDCMSSEWYKFNVTEPGFEIDELTGDLKDGHSSYPSTEIKSNGRIKSIRPIQS